MKQPKNQLAEVLNLLLTKDRTSLDIIMCGVLNPTSKISQLRDKGVVVLCDKVKHTNKFGRKIPSIIYLNGELCIKSNNKSLYL